MWVLISCFPVWQLYETFSHSEIFDFIQIQFFSLSERRTYTHADEHSVQGSSPLTLGIRGDFLSMYRDYTLNVLYICSKSYIFAYILWSREMAISKARLNNFIPVFQWGEKFHLIAKWVSCCIKKIPSACWGTWLNHQSCVGLFEGTQWSHVALLAMLPLAPNPDPGEGLCSRTLLGTELPLADLFLGTRAELLNKTLFFRLRDDRFDGTMKSASSSWYS